MHYCVRWDLGTMWEKEIQYLLLRCVRECVRACVYVCVCMRVRVSQGQKVGVRHPLLSCPWGRVILDSESICFQLFYYPANPTGSPVVASYHTGVKGTWVTTPGFWGLGGGAGIGTLVLAEDQAPLTTASSPALRSLWPSSLACLPSFHIEQT